MIQRQLKLKLTKRQEQDLERWLFHFTSVWNWAVRKIENDAHDRIYHSESEFKGLLKGHSKKLNVPAQSLRELLVIAHRSWERCFKKAARQPRFKGRRNRLNYVSFPNGLCRPRNNRIIVPRLGSVRFHGQAVPEGNVKYGQIVRRPSGWYLCLFVDAEPNVIPRVADGQIGIDPGFNYLLTLSTGEKVSHPRELEASALRHDPHKHKRYYSPTLVQLRTAVKPESKPYFWTPRLRLLLISVLLMAGALSVGIYLLVNGN